MIRPDTRGPTRVALIDDTPDFRLLLRLVLDSDEGYSVVAEAADGLSGVEAVRECRPDLVLLDLAMPVMDGLEALPLILKASPASRVVVLSGFEQARMGQVALQSGAAAYLQKGASPKHILDVISAVLGSSDPTRTDEPRAAESGAVTGAGDGDAARTMQAGSELEALRAALATAAHELRSPATVLVGLARTLRQRDSFDDDVRNQLLDAIVRQALVLDRVTTDLLTSSQSERGKLAVESQPMLLLPALSAAAVAVSDRDRLQVHCRSDITVQGDRVRVEQMLANLISNALKYGQPPVRIEADYAGDCVEVRVQDRGPGVPADFVPRLFQCYARADGLRASGTGIGLYVVKSLAEAQGGAAWYESRAGGGSQFCFSLPCPVNVEAPAEQGDDAA